MNYGAAAKFYAGWYPRLWLPRFGTPGEVELPRRLRRHLRYLERATRRLARDLFHMMVRYRQGLQKKQMVLARLVDTGSDLFAMAAALSWAAAGTAPAGAERLADLFCRQARRRVAARHRGVYANDDGFAYKTARAVLEDQYPWLTRDNIVSAWRRESGRS
jgi:hypothetical protein